MSAATLSGLVERHRSTWIALGNWETRRLAARLPAAVERPIFIAGLARAGTTTLLRKLAALPGLASHRYSDFPFLFTPYFWHRLNGRPRRQAPRERMHKDGILVTAESPEAMEEMLWMAYFDGLHDPRRSNLLDAASARPAFDAFYADHIRKILLIRGGNRYVSKNNYNITRFAYLARLFPDARFLLPIRAPYDHVASMLKQHRLFAAAEAKDPSITQHLRRIGHVEFGLGRQPINPGDTAATRAVLDCWAAGDEVRGWAKYWALVYGAVQAQLAADAALASRCQVVRFEDLCDHPAETVTGLVRHLGLPDDAATLADLASGFRRPDYYTPSFTEAEQSAIVEETADVARRYGYSSPHATR